VEINHEPLDLSALCNELVDELRRQEPERNVVTEIQPDVRAEGDRHLMRDALSNLISNAWKFTSKQAQARIRFGTRQTNGATVYYVEDNGAGFDPNYAERLFTPFQRLHHARDFPGTGIGLSTVRRIIQRHAGCLWASSRADGGATFYFTLQSPRPDGVAENDAVTTDLNSAAAGPM
jgi:light-regulated signal transduction histidine kinase (bacteriophytochrome)